jgi:fused signal recognition particle receptor
MAFNWFNRDLNQPPEAAPPTAESAADAASPEALQTPVADETLNFAKAAFENIKRKQQEAAAAAQAAEAPTVEPVAEPIAEPVVEPVGSPVKAAVESVVEPVAEPQIEAAVESGVVLQVEAIAEPVAELVAELVAEPVTEPVTEPVAGLVTEPVTEPVAGPQVEPTVAPADQGAPETEANVPMWVKAEADRQARLDRLRETAIVVPEPVVAIEPTTEIFEPVLLDGDFLWSAEVLASQGRRAEDITLEEITWLTRLRQGLDKTRLSLINSLKSIVGKGPLNEDAVMEIEALLLQADVGVAATDAIIGSLQARLKEDVLPPDQAIAYLKQLLRELLDKPLTKAGGTFEPADRLFVPNKDVLNIWLITGVNGAGKTTTIGKLTHIAQKSGYKCLIAAADTFRAAAVEQVKVWGERSNVEVIANPAANADPAAVVFDAISAAQARGTELLLVDTAGRLQNKKNLMDELSKIRRIIDKKASDAQVESLLVLDATLGQNGLQQAKVFSEAVQLSGVVLTKLDGTAKGGIALAVVQQLGLPIRFIGAGEGIEDLRPFSSYEFVEALVSG